MVPTIDRLKTASSILSHMGVKWVGRRAIWALQHRAHWWEFRTRSRAWNDIPLVNLLGTPALADAHRWVDYRRELPLSFFFDPTALPSFRQQTRDWDFQSLEHLRPVEICHGLAAGELQFFGHQKFHVGNPPAWHRNPRTDVEIPAQVHWSRISDFAQGDIKYVWEPSRFGWAFALVRAYQRTGDDRWAELFWSWFADWCRSNPPFQGANWKCGQEISLRVMAATFAFYGLAVAPSSTPARQHQLLTMMAVAGDRVAAHIDYALSQRNNHGISESVGLWTIGLLFPELKQARKWEQQGRTLLESLARQLVYDDGGFSQYSWNYHRVAMQLFTWAIVLAERNRVPFSAELKLRVGAAVSLACQFIDLPTGQMPVWGQNDGALVMPLSDCDARDFRPALQAAHAAVHGKGCFPPGPWDEECCWTSGPSVIDATRADCQQQSLTTQPNGYTALRTEHLAVFTRCGPFLDRPSQADLLHIDLRWRSQPIAIDPGTYSYNDRPPWDNPLAETRYHNTVTVNHQDQMRRVSRFLWLPWLCGETMSPLASPANQIVFWQGRHDGYKPAASYARQIALLGRDCCVVVDVTWGSVPHTARLQWLLEDFPYDWYAATQSLILQTPSGPYAVHTHSNTSQSNWHVIRSSEETPQGWRARYYGQREPAISLVGEVRAKTAMFWTVFAPSTHRVEFGEKVIEIEASAGDGMVHFSTAGGPSQIGVIQWNGDQLNVAHVRGVNSESVGK